jgi:chromosome segregation ATPase
VLIPEEKLEEYQESFNRILKATGAKDIDELVRNFIEAEERNFTLSKFVGELTVETEQLEEQVVQIKKEIEEYKNQGLGENNERKKMQKELEEKIRRNEDSYEAHMQEYKATLDKISSIKTSIEEIFTLAGENNETAKRFRALQESQGLTQDNILQYLAMVEEMINEMIKQYAFLLAQKLKITKDLDDDDPVIVTLHNILMVAPKTEGTRYDQLNVKEDLAQQEEMMGQVDEDENPLDFNDFQKRFQNKQLK